jgi:UDP-glucose 4-epimerase
LSRSSQGSKNGGTALAARYAGKKCLVTGGLGFIGSNLALALVEAGASVAVVDSLEPRHGGDMRNLEGAPVRLAIGDIAEPSVVAEQLIDAEYVFNLAGQVSHVDSMTAPVRDLDINARSQLGFLELLRQTNAGAMVVYASTRQVYGSPRWLPVNEIHPVDPIDVNGVSKLAAECFHLLYHQVYGVPATVLRITNVYGPRQSLEGDHQGFLPAWIRRALRGESITVYGEGSQVRDCLYIDDAVSALLAAGSCGEAVGEVFNIGHHERHSLLEIAETVTDAFGDGEVVMTPWPAGLERISVGSYWTDYRKARDLLGWEPVWTLAQGMEETSAYYRAQLAWHR